ncbi:MAG: TonB-dependent receptor [Myxococcota bacterium]
MRRSAPKPALLVLSIFLVGAGDDRITSGETSEVEQIEVIHRRRGWSSTASWDAVPWDRVQRSDAASVAEVLRRAPGASIRTNSRGQTLVFLRQGGERSVGTFYEGVPLDVPWDHRFDLGLLPATALGGAEVARGPVALRYGPQAAGGAVFLSARPVERPAELTLAAEGGEAGHQRGQGWAGVQLGTAWTALLAGERTVRSGEPLAEALAFSQPDRRLRTNTDARRSSALFRLHYGHEGTEFTVGALYGRATFGVAPEAHLDPRADRVRFWRYPHSQLVMAFANAQTELGLWRFEASAWAQSFRQTIDSFGSAAYARLEQRQQDQDESLGLRTRAAVLLGMHELSATFFGRGASHGELRTEGLGSRPLASEEERFVQADWSASVDYAFAGDRFGVEAAMGVAGLEPLETAGRASSGGLRGVNLTFGGSYELSNACALKGAAGTRVRLPTPRELFGTALDRFVVNEGLDPERVSSAELGLLCRGSFFSVQLTPFLRMTEGTLDQENIVVDGVTLRRRINLDGSRAFGVEVVGDLRLRPWLRLGGQVMGVDVRSTEGPDRRLTERPAVQGFGELVLGAQEGLEVAAELFAQSDAYGLAPEGLRSVDGGALLHLRAAYRINHPELGGAELYLRVDNLLAERLEPQLGLPLPGRWMRVGVILRL